MIHVADSAFSSKFKVEAIPCEFIYIKIIARSPTFNNKDLDALHQLLYNPKNKVGWQTMEVYDEKCNYQFSHDYTGRIYYWQGGN